MAMDTAHAESQLRINETLALIAEMGVAESERCKDRMKPHFVYIVKTQLSGIVYVGISIRPRERLMRHKKESDWWPDNAICDVEILPSRRAALNREKELIKAHKPNGNKVHNKYWWRGKNLDLGSM